jgi:hypothetical protein
MTGTPAVARTIESAIPPPAGFVRASAEPGSFGAWLRRLPLQSAGAKVMLFDGREKARQDVHLAVLDIDTGRKDLQQCADAVMRLRAEFLFSAKRFADIHFRFTSGDTASYTNWIAGYRPVVNGNKVRWERKKDRDTTYAGFRSYLDTVFTYAGSSSLSRELESVADIRGVRAGDVFIRGGFPGHAVLVVDAAENRQTGERVFLIVQSYMPAQDIHVLKNPADPALSPWYRPPAGPALKTPEWEFSAGELKRFR